MSTSTAAGGRPPGMPTVPQDWTKLPEDFVLEQPPAQFAHLEGDALYEALVGDQSELWNRLRIAVETGRSPATVDKWANRRNAIHDFHTGKSNVMPPLPDDNTLPQWAAKYGTGAEVWLAGDVRKWANQAGKMDRRGVLIPYSPTGNRNDAVAGKVKSSEVREIGPLLLAEVNRLRAQKVSMADAHAQVAAAHGLTPTSLKKRLEAGRAEARPSMEAFLAGYLGSRGATVSSDEAVAGLAREHDLPELDARNRVWMAARAAKRRDVMAEMFPEVPVT